MYAHLIPRSVLLTGSIGIYIDALDARPDKNTVVGSQHAFMMAVMDKLLDHLRTLQLSKVKGELDARHAGQGVILDGFKHGEHNYSFQSHHVPFEI